MAEAVSLPWQPAAVESVVRGRLVAVSAPTQFIAEMRQAVITVELCDVTLDGFRATVTLDYVIGMRVMAVSVGQASGTSS